MYVVSVTGMNHRLIKSIRGKIQTMIFCRLKESELLNQMHYKQDSFK